MKNILLLLVMVISFLSFEKVVAQEDLVTIEIGRRTGCSGRGLCTIKPPPPPPEEKYDTSDGLAYVTFLEDVLVLKIDVSSINSQKRHLLVNDNFLTMEESLELNLNSILSKPVSLDSFKIEVGKYPVIEKEGYYWVEFKSIIENSPSESE